MLGSWLDNASGKKLPATRPTKGSLHLQTRSRAPPVHRRQLSQSTLTYKHRRTSSPGTSSMYHEKQFSISVFCFSLFFAVFESVFEMCFLFSDMFSVFRCFSLFSMENRHVSVFYSKTVFGKCFFVFHKQKCSVFYL